MVKIRQYLIPQSDWTTGRKKSPYSMTPEFITIHNTANDASANNEARYVRDNVSSGNMSYHFAVDDIEAVQLLPLNRNGWHAGDGVNGAGNRKTIGIEICYSKSGGTKFTKSEKNAAELTAKLLIERGWGIDRVKKHQDWSGKYCPHRTLDLGWQRFLNMVKSHLAPEWVKMDTPRRMRAKGKINLYEVTTGKVISTYDKATIFELIQKTSWNGQVYLRTEYSSTKNIHNGFNFADLEELPVAPPVEPEPTPPIEPPTEPELPVEQPVEPPVVPEVPPTLPQPPNILELLRQLLKSILNWIKGDR